MNNTLGYCNIPLFDQLCLEQSNLKFVNTINTYVKDLMREFNSQKIYREIHNVVVHY